GGGVAQADRLLRGQPPSHRLPYLPEKGLGHRQRSDGGGVQDHRGAPEGLGDALGRGGGGHRGDLARPVRQRRQGLGRLLGPTTPHRSMKLTQVKDSHPQDRAPRPGSLGVTPLHQGNGECGTATRRSPELLHTSSTTDYNRGQGSVGATGPPGNARTPDFSGFSAVGMFWQTGAFGRSANSPSIGSACTSS